jgi:hypothetical protein
MYYYWQDWSCKKLYIRKWQSWPLYLFLKLYKMEHYYHEWGGSMAESSSLKLPVSLRCGGITLESGSGTECSWVENSRGFPCLLQKRKEKKRNSQPLFCNALILGYPTYSPIFGASSNKLKVPLVGIRWG